MMNLDGSNINKIGASYSQFDGLGLKYYKDDKVKPYGTNAFKLKEWEFDDTKLLVGLHGRVSGTTIK